jgi:hypothetical protein
LFLRIEEIVAIIVQFLGAAQGASGLSHYLASCSAFRNPQVAFNLTC